VLYSDLMIDLETLGVDHGSVITQIGLCAFNAGDDPDSPVESTSFCVDIAMSLNLGFKVQGNTILWWCGRATRPVPRLSIARRMR